MIPRAIQELADELARLPGIGPRQALRIAFFLSRAYRTDIDKLAGSINALKNIKECADCFLMFEGQSPRCPICLDQKRDSSTIAVIEKETDLISLERSGAFNGKYLITGELKREGVLEQSHRLRIAKLKERITRDSGGSANEIIIALSPTTYGDIQASVLQSELSGLAKKITRLGRGIPTGGEIEFADELTLSDALRHRD